MYLISELEQDAEWVREVVQHIVKVPSTIRDQLIHGFMTRLDGAIAWTNVTNAGEVSTFHVTLLVRQTVGGCGGREQTM